MPPTVQTSSSADRDRKLRPGEKKSDLVCRVKYCNTLPDIPFDPKFINYPFLSTRFVEYKPTSLERNYKHDLLTEHDLGVKIDLINNETYAVDHTSVLSMDDELLLEEDALTPKDSKRSRHHNKAVPWLKKTEYISNEFNRYGQITEKTETKVGYNVKKLFKEENMYMDRDSQITAINKTFSDNKIPVENHYSKPNVYAVEELPIFPDFQCYRHPFAQVIFDTEPVDSTKVEEMSQAMIRGVVDDSGEQFVAYFLPTQETLNKRKRDAENDVEFEDEEIYEYKMAREYNWNVKNKLSKGYVENYVFVNRDGALYYNELETRVRLNKRRLKPGAVPGRNNSNSTLMVKHRPLNEAEFKAQEVRMLNLEAPVEEEEEEEEVQETNEEEKENEEENAASSASEAEDKNDDKETEEKEAESEKESTKGSPAARSRRSSSVSSASSSSSRSSKASSKASSKSSRSSKSSKSSKASSKGSPASKASSKRSPASSKGSPASKASSKSSSSSSSSSSSESEAEEVDQKKKDKEEIFGSDSD